MKLTITAGPPTLTDPEDSASAFAAMEEEAIAGYTNAEFANPILPCRRPYIELTLLGEDDLPAAHAKYSLLLPGGGARTGSLDANGFVHLDDLDVAADEVMLQVEIVENDDDPESTPEFTIQLVPKGAQPTVEGMMEEEPLQEEYFNPTFDHRVIASADPEEAEDLDEL